MDEAISAIRNGDFIATPGGGSFPRGFDAAIGPYAKRCGWHLNIIAPFQLEMPKMLDSAYEDNITLHSFFFGAERDGYAPDRKNLRFIPMHLSKTGNCVTERHPRVVVMSCAPPDENGWMSRSVWGTHVHRDNFESNDCEVVIAEVNRNLPYLCSDGEKHTMLHVSESDYIVENDYLWKEIKTPQSTEVEKVIAGYVAELIPNGACLQLGFGGLPDAVGENLAYAGKHDIGLQTEVLSNCIAGLMHDGIINNSLKSTCTGRSVAGAVVGDRALWKFCDHNPDICMKEIDWVNDAANIAKNDNVVSINTAMEIDLTGQVAAEAIGPHEYSGTGGQLDWVIGSQMSRGGKSIITMSSTYRDKIGAMRSKISPMLKSGSIVTTPRNCVQYVITEYGVADLRYKTTLERARALIGIAHPDFRRELIRKIDTALF